MSQTEFAEKTGIHQQSLSKYERGVTEPGLGVLLKFAAALNVDLQTLTGWKSDVKILNPGVNFQDTAIEHEVQLYGEVGAGPGRDEPEDPPAWVRVPGRRKEGVVAFRVRGSSMEDFGLSDGDVILVRTEPIADPGDIVVAWVESLGGCVVKKLSQNEYGQDLLGKGRDAIKLGAKDRVYGVYVGTVPKAKKSP